MHDMLDGKFASLTDFGGRIGSKERIWVQGESSESMKEGKTYSRR